MQTLTAGSRSISRVSRLSASRSSRTASLAIWSPIRYGPPALEAAEHRSRRTRAELRRTPIQLYRALEPGTKPLQTLVAETKRGLLVTRLWYVRIVDQRTVLLTGMTRDGTFLIENGALKGGVRNMRFNASIVAALNDCELSDTQTRTGSYHYSLVTPAIKFNSCHFASASPY